MLHRRHIILETDRVVKRQTKTPTNYCVKSSVLLNDVREMTQYLKNELTVDVYVM